MQLFNFLKSKYFLYQVLITIIVSVILIWFFLVSLGWITDHGKAVSVPNIKGFPLDKARLLAEDRGLQVEIMDSTFVLNTKPGMILEQDPKKGTPVKPGRKIYVSIQVFSAPFIKMPNVKDASLRQAMAILKSYGLNLGKVIYKADYASNAVLFAQLNGAIKDAGAKVRKGSFIDLVVANGLGSEEMQVPSLSGNTLEEAKVILEEYHLQLGVIIKDDDAITDSVGAFIYKQSPDVYDDLGNPVVIRMGQTIDVWLTTNPEKIKIDSLQQMNRRKTEGSTLDLNN